MKDSSIYKTEIGFLAHAMIRRWIVVCIFVCSASAPLLSQPIEMQFDRLSHEEGLSQSVVICVLQDSTGYLWFGTQEGLNRYDGYQFTTYRHNAKDPTTIASDFILCLYEDASGTLWVGTNGGGLDAYNPLTEVFTHHRHDPEDANSLSHNEVVAVVGGSMARGPILWLATRGGGLNSFEPNWGRFNHFSAQNNKIADNDLTSLCSTGDLSKSGYLWLGTQSEGLTRFDPRQSSFKQFRTADGLSNNGILALHADQRQGQEMVWVGTLAGLNRFLVEDETFVLQPLSDQDGDSTVSVRAIHENRRGSLWVGTKQAAFKLNREQGKVQDYTYKAKDKIEILSIFEDQAGVLWMGTHGDGLYRYDLNRERFLHYKHNPKNSNSLANDMVFSILEGRDGRIWFCTLAGGVDVLDPKARRFKHYGAADGLPDDSYYAMAETPDQDLWMGSNENGLYLFRPGEGVLAHYQHEPGNPSSISDNWIRSLSFDSRGRLWVGTAEGLNLRDAQADNFLRFNYKANDQMALGHGNVQWIFELGDSLWLGTLGGGLSSLHLDSEVIQTFIHDPEDPQSLSHNQVLTLYGDASGAPDVLWVGSNGGGLNKLFIPDKRFIRYDTEHGMPNDVVNSILGDAKGNLWMSTNHGITRFNPDQEKFTNYGVQHGLQGFEFAQTAAVSTRNGRMYFGGTNGVSVFNPQDMSKASFVPHVRVTDFLIFNKSVALRRVDDNSPITQPIGITKYLELSHKRNMFSFQFASLNPATPAAIEYSYKLDGLNNDWITTSARNRFATFTNLSPKTYHFNLRARGENAEWREMKTRIIIKIQPPPWRTIWAYALYVIALTGLTFYYVSNQRKKLAFERAVNERQNAVNERLRQVDKFKDEILANTSHELRTPLHGIIGLADSLRDGSAGKLPLKAVSNLDMIISSGKRLTTLVNDILDFSKLKTKKLDLKKTPVDLYTLTEMVLNLSKPLLASKDLELINAIPTSLPPLLADENRLQQILHNLVGNAIKFTNEGFVKISTTLDSEDDRLNVQVIDTGIGIPESKIESIFNAFEQADTSAVRSYGGTGLGLAITKHLVAMHGGTLSVNSVLDKGTIFTFTLPLSDVDGDVNSVDFESDAKVHAFSEDDMVRASEFTLPQDGDAVVTEAPIEDGTRTQSKLLIVDDEPINRQVLVNYLDPLGYHLVEAANGYDALKQVEKETPFDLILLDIMMPRMSGYEVCANLRKIYSVNELPIIFLTAKNQAQDMVTGFASGANDYLTKPISKSELTARVRTHIKLLHFHRSLETKVSERTRELRLKNQELDAKYQELETFDNIVKTINREVELENVVEILLEQGLVLLEQAEKATFLSYSPASKSFRYLCCRGYNLHQLKKLTLTLDEIEQLYTKSSREVRDGIFILHHLEPTTLSSRLMAMPAPASQVIMTLRQENRLTGILTMDHGQDEHVFEEMDIEKLLRFRELAVNAVARARVIDDLVGTQNELVEAANMAGKAEIATNVLHNVGNTLNSVRTSVHMIQEQMFDPKWLMLFERVVLLLHEHEENLALFFAAGERSQMLISALDRIHSHFGNQAESLGAETRRLVAHVQNIVGVLMEQERHAHFQGSAAKSISINDTIEETLHMEAYLLKHKRLKVQNSLGDVPHIHAEKSKLVRILFNLLKNAWQAIEEAGIIDGTIFIGTSKGQQTVLVEIRDNGTGISPELLQRVFEQGFSTKKHCEGFGLHYAANAMGDMCGSIRLENNSGSKGCRVLLSFPAVQQEKHRLRA